VAIALVQVGFDVVVAGRREGPLHETCAAARALRPTAQVIPLVADVEVAADCAGVIEAAATFLGQIGVLVNAAATCEAEDVMGLSAESWDHTLNINLRGSALCSSAAARHMSAAGGGRIILFSSINGAISEPQSAAYSAGKAAISSLARTFAVDLGDQNIAVNAVAPGWVDTPMTAGFLVQATPETLQRLNPLGRLGRPEEIASVVLYLATEAPLFLTGTTLFVDGGQTAVASVP
jgi:NAD(P)-dependent dehydrogenase (short-subunit alcohol dehydrogenase family)